MSNESLWMIGAASVRGKGHVKINLPNQDAYDVAMSRDGNIIVAVVSDGAGSAPRAEEGAKACVKIMLRCLLDIGENHRDAVADAFKCNSRDQQLIQERVTQGLQHVRDYLDPTGQQLKDFHHTFTGAVLTPAGGFVAQIGDSPALITHAEIVFDQSGKRREVDFFAKHEVLMAEKGEYANETSFVTQPDWLASLRYAPFHIDNQRAVLLMSDGAGELAISKGQAFRPFIGTLIHQMIKADSRHERDQVLHSNLTHPQADALTADDKTLVILCHRDWQKLAVLPHIDELDVEDSSPGQKPDTPPVVPTEQRRPTQNNLVLFPLLTFALGAGMASAYFLTRGEAAQPPRPTTTGTRPAPIKGGGSQPEHGNTALPTEPPGPVPQIAGEVEEKKPIPTEKIPKVQPKSPGNQKKTPASNTAANDTIRIATERVITAPMTEGPPEKAPLLLPPTNSTPEASPTGEKTEPTKSNALSTAPDGFPLRNASRHQK